MAPLFLIFCLAVVLVAGIAVIAYLFRRRAMWPAFFLTIAFVAILVLLYAAFVQAPPIGSNKRSSSGIKASDTTTTDSTLPIYAAIFGYGIMGAMACMIAGVKGVMLLTLVLIMTVPQILTFYRNYLIFSAVITFGVVAAGSLTSFVSFMRGRSKYQKRIGSDSFSHVLYYPAILMLISAGWYCKDLTVFSETLAIGFVCACVGSQGIMLETNLFSAGV
jgi:hypothetical protein